MKKINDELVVQINSMSQGAQIANLGGILQDLQKVILEKGKAEISEEALTAIMANITENLLDGEEFDSKVREIAIEVATKIATDISCAKIDEFTELISESEGGEDEQDNPDDPAEETGTDEDETDIPSDPEDSSDEDNDDSPEPINPEDNNTREIE